MGSNQWL